MRCCREYFKYTFVNKVIAVTEYLKDGLTINRRKNNISSPKGCWNRAKIILEAYEKRKIKNGSFFVKSMLQYQVYGRFAKENLRDLYEETKFKKWYILLYPFAWIIYLKWKYCRSKI